MRQVPSYARTPTFQLAAWRRSGCSAHGAGPRQRSGGSLGRINRRVLPTRRNGETRFNSLVNSGPPWRTCCVTRRYRRIMKRADLFISPLAPISRDYDWRPDLRGHLTRMASVLSPNGSA